MPWQSGGGGQGPWGGPPRGPRPPNLEDLLKGGQERFRQMFPGGFWATTGFIVAAAVILGIWLISGFYRVLPDEQGVVLRFGAYDRTAAPGLHYHLPAPIETVYTPKVTVVNQVEVGYQSGPSARGGPRQVPQEALMLTGDENIVDINFAVYWVIKDAKNYLFNVRAPEATVKAAAESAMREIIGQTPIDSALAEGRGMIQEETQKLLQDILDYYGAGIQITQLKLQKVDPPGPVIDAFRDVQRAKADQVRLQNEAEGYRNDIIPRARGEAAQIEQEAEAYKQEVVARSEGDAKRFISVQEAYALDKDVTARRLYLETLESVLKNTNKIIIDTKASASGVVPYLPLPELKARSGGDDTDSESGTPSPSSAPRMTVPTPETGQP